MEASRVYKSTEGPIPTGISLDRSETDSSRQTQKIALIFKMFTSK